MMKNKLKVQIPDREDQSHTANTIYVKQVHNDPVEQIQRQGIPKLLHLDLQSRSRASSVKNEQFVVEQLQQLPRPPKIIRQIIKKPEGDLQWPLFKVRNDNFIKQFWVRRTISDVERKWNTEDYLFSGILMRIGRKKKLVKGYYYRLTCSGMLMYYKKETDTLPKGYLQLTIQCRVSILLQKTKRNHILPVLYIESTHGLGITIFDHQVDSTMKLCEFLQEFCLMRGYEQAYEQADSLGAGAFASVYKVRRRKDDKIFAAKTYLRQVYEDNQHKDKFQQMVYNEVQVLKSVSHPGIMEIFEIYQEKDKLIIILEYCSGGTLYNYFKQHKKLSEKQIAQILRPICEALGELHRCNFVHRDLKLDNIMLESKDISTLKLVDFGFAEAINDKVLTCKSGTPGFLPPEIFKSQPYTAKGDMFSLGVILYLLISGTAPFKAPKAQQIIEQNKKCIVSFDKPLWQDITQDLRFIVKRLLEPKPEDRLTCTEILESSFILHHTKFSSETNYQTISGVKQQSGFDPEKKGPSIKSIKNSNESSETSQQHKDFQLEFSIYTNDIKSLYQKNSIKTVNSQKSNKSILKKSSHKVISKSPKDMMASISQDREKKIDKSNKSIVLDNSSFGEMIKSKHFRLITFDDFDSLSLPQVGFLKRASKVFNRPKRPEVD